MGSDEQRFNELATDISQQISSVQNNTRQIRTLAKYIGGERDSESLRSQIHSLTHATMALCQRATEQLKGQLQPMCSGAPGMVRAVQKDRLVDQLTKVAGEFQEAQRLVRAREKEQLQQQQPQQKQQQQQEQAGGFDSMFGNSAEDDNPFTFGGVDQQQQQQQQRQQQLDLEAAEQRESQLHQLEQDIVGINDMFKDLAVMVHEQGEALDSIEDHVGQAVMHVDSGNKNLTNAVQYKRSARRKKIIFAVIIVAILIIIGIIVYLSIPKNN